MKWVVVRLGLGIVFGLGVVCMPFGSRLYAQEVVCTPDMVLPTIVGHDGYAEVTVVPEDSSTDADSCAVSPVVDIALSAFAQTGGEIWMDANKAETAPNAAVGTHIAWRIVVTNNSTQAIAKLSVLLTSPLHVTDLVLLPEVGSVNEWNWMIPEVQAGESVALYITGVATASGETDVSARVQSIVSEGNTENNQDLAVVVVNGTQQTGVLGESTNVSSKNQGGSQTAVLAAATGVTPRSSSPYFWLLTGLALLGVVLTLNRDKRALRD